MELTEAGRRVLEARYLQRNSEGKLRESPEQMIHRVAHSVARNMDDYASFYRVMNDLDFLPNSPTLMNAGTELGQLSACFVVPVEDTMEGIFESLKHAALIQKSGGGVGFSFSRLRPRGARVRTTQSVAGGPVEFIRMFDAAAQCVKQGGKRFGANIGVLRVDHPDILEFVNMKNREGVLRWFNLSVGITDDFMRKAQQNQDYLLEHGSGGGYGWLNAGAVMGAISKGAWENGEPGVLFIDRINAEHRVRSGPRIEATNPCGEQPLMPYESCNLGSVNLRRMVEDDGTFLWDKLRDTVRIAIRFLDSVIDRNRYPIEEIQRQTLYTRKIGLGVMGFHDALALMGVPYASEKALDTASAIASFMRKEADDVSRELAEEFGPYPWWSDRDGPKRRNGTLLTIAPTGSISTIADCSSGIEPWFALSYDRLSVGTSGERVFQPIAIGLLQDWGVWERVREDVESHGYVHLRSDVLTVEQQNLMLTALHISGEQHIRMQSAWQMWVDNAVSKTVNVPYDSDVGRVRKLIEMAWSLGCKGVTIYRDGSRKTQAQDTRGRLKTCPTCGEGLVYKGGKCLECPQHGPVECSI